MNKFTTDINAVADFLKIGGVALLPTDTVYGLAASPLFPNAVARIFKLKARPTQQNLPIMVASVKDMEDMGLDINDAVKKILASSFVPGDITIVMGFKTTPSRSHRDKSVSWLAGREEVAVRIPNHPIMLSILEKTGPLLVTSANRHGNPTTPLTVPEIIADLTGLPGKIMDGGSVENVPSTIINCRVSPPKIERTGRISYEDLFNLLNK
jgi:L-threonylcarbamoyladenylate synthase